ILAAAARMLDEGAAPPSRRLLILLGAMALARPEAGLLVAGIVVVRAGAAALERRPRDAARWLAPLAAPFAVALANRLLARPAAPNTAVAKSYFYLPGFDWSFWARTVLRETGALLRGLFWSGLDGLEPLWLPRLTLLLWVAGAWRLCAWARREGRLAGAL